MSNKDKRLKHLEQKAPSDRQFIGWKGNPWTEEEKLKAIRSKPNDRIFWRPLLEGTRCRNGIATPKSET